MTALDYYWSILPQMASISIASTLKALSDDKSLVLFNMAAFILTRNTAVVMNRLGLARKQYYSRMNRLIDGGLVMRKSSKYFLTSFGKVVYESQMLIGQAIENYWMLKAIDSIETSPPDHDLSAEERKRIIDALIESNNIKNILLNHKIRSNQNDKISQINIKLYKLFMCYLGIFF